MTHFAILLEACRAPDDNRPIEWTYFWELPLGTLGSFESCDVTCPVAYHLVVKYETKSSNRKLSIDKNVSNYKSRAIQNMQIYFLFLEKFHIFYLLKKITIYDRMNIKTT